MSEDVLTAVASIVTCFQSSAGLIHSISHAREQQRQKKRRRKDADRDEAAHGRLLYTALLTGAQECHEASVQRHHRYGPAFGNGDVVAMAELNDVVMALQGEVIRSLQAARDVRDATLDLTRLHESAVANRLRAVRALDGLCERIVSGLEPLSSGETRGISRAYTYTADVRRTHTRNISLPSYSYAASDISPPLISPTYPTYLLVDSSSQSSSSAVSGLHRSSSDHSVSRSSSSSSNTSAYSWSSISPRRRRADTGDLSLSDLSIHEKDAVDSQISAPVPLVELSGLPPDRAIPPSATRHRHGIHKVQNGFNTVCRIPEEDEPISAFPGNDSGNHLDHELATSLPNFNASGFSGVSQPDHYVKRSDVPHQALVDSKYPPRLATIHPAMRNLYLEDPVELSPEPDHAWEPLARPAKHNNYHNFCKGAWQTRRSIRQGLNVSQGEDPKGKPVPLWECRHCAFSAASSADNLDLPNQIFVHFRTGIRYRWAFLAYSHAAAVKSLPRSSSYRYGCILCAAQGHETDTFEHLDSLMTHFVTRHKTQLLTPEVLTKTQCVIEDGTAPSLPWNLCLPASVERKQGLIGGIMSSAVGGLAARSTLQESLRR